ncbi:hypothetical protein BDV96DRAFT_642969 [Lophiotrema nucula]|uniref:Oxidoreductase acuF-like C2H2 type zinc-finger domain-containing protein n=1 Tax=Lophiotrema nucula TaxID=690887 RepID=A0A6A5ZHZ9_9PLEO|nr:hypothetical protein BDV96DRAFT_642969 [Lophiotrema nucula]
MTALISDAHARCYLAFEGLIHILGNPARDYRFDLSSTEAQEIFDRYAIWAGNVGAAHSGRRYEISLDYRLREASFYRSQVMTILSNLESRIQDVASLLRNERKPFEEQILDSDEENSDIATSTVVGEEEDESEDSPWDISSDSSGEWDTPPKPRSMSTSEGQGPSELIPNKSNQPPVSDMMKLAKPPTAEMPRLLESIKFNVSCLYRLPIRKPAPLDRIKHSTTHDLSMYQHLDVMYVRDKFPHLDVAVATRLGKLITRRRQILYYREAHKQSLETARVQPKSVSKRTIGSTSLIVQAIPDSQHSSLDDQPTPSQLALSQAASSQYTLRTKATTLRLGGLDSTIPSSEIDVAALYAPSIAESKSSMASSFAGKYLNVEIPSRPSDEDGQELDMFECPYCLTTKIINSSHKWKKHVFDDIQPYVCTFSDCELYDHFFDNRDDWYNHESQHHRTNWHCNADGHEGFEAEPDFLDHMRTIHKTDFVDSKFPFVKDHFRHPSRNIEGTCNLCMQYSKKLRSHVSRHLQQMALFALPRVNQTDGSGKAERNSTTSRVDVDYNEERANSYSDRSSSSSEGSKGNLTEEGKDYPRDNSSIDEEYGTEDIPDIVEATWDGITDKFSKARERSWRPLTVMIWELDWSVSARIKNRVRNLGCEVLCASGEKEVGDILDGSRQLDILFVPRAFRALRDEVSMGHDKAFPEPKLVLVDHDFDLLTPEKEYFDGILGRPFREAMIIRILKDLCHWEPPADIQDQLCLLEFQLQVVRDLQSRPELSDFVANLEEISRQLEDTLDDSVTSPYPTWEVFKLRLLKVDDAVLAHCISYLD